MYMINIYIYVHIVICVVIICVTCLHVTLSYVTCVCPYIHMFVHMINIYICSQYINNIVYDLSNAKTSAATIMHKRLVTFKDLFRLNLKEFFENMNLNFLGRHYLSMRFDTPLTTGDTTVSLISPTSSLCRSPLLIHFWICVNHFLI